jgi:hypothetical protein
MLNATFRNTLQQEQQRQQQQQHNYNNNNNNNNNNNVCFSEKSMSTKSM